jgi:hypothetical protein
MARQRGALLAAALLVLVAACSGSDTTSSVDRSDQRSGGVAEAPLQDVLSALEDRENDAFPAPLTDLDELLSGGPPPDGIPPIDDPHFEQADEVDWLEDTEAVLSLTVEGETRAYPLRVMTWHEIVNDVVGGIPVAVTYCPLCNSGWPSSAG